MSEMSSAGTGDLLQQLSNEMASAVERAGASTVRVNARRRLPGTGIVWSSENGHNLIVTANHIVERDEDITVVTNDGNELPAQLVGRDPGSDLAVLRVEGAGLPASERVTTEKTRVGSIALAMGRAGDLSATTGVVSSVGGSGEGRRGRRSRSLISTDAPMFPGFSGGPLIDASGAVIGLLSSHLGRGQTTLAIPSDDVERIASSIKTHGRVRRGYLGIAAQQVGLPANLRQSQGIDQENGLLLIGVDDDGPAGQAGLGIGDIVVAIEGQSVGSLDELRAALGSDSVGQQVTVKLLRGGQPQELSVTVGEQQG